MEKSVYALIYNPWMESENADLITAMGWNDPLGLSKQYIDDVREASHGELEYVISHTASIDDIPVKADGYRYTREEFLAVVRSGGRLSHQPDGADYVRIMEDHGIVDLANSGRIDELWVFGAPWIGFWESYLPGPGSFFYNSPEFEYPELERLLPIMGFSYERDVGCMLEDLGHRTEATMTHVFGGWDVTKGRHDLDRFGHNIGQTPHVPYYQVGSVHYPPNGEQDYDWGNPEQVLSNCDAWLEYPSFPEGKVRWVDCSEWGCSQRGYLKWWLSHIPHAPGETRDVLNNWWAYVRDPDLASDTAKRLRASGR